MLIDLSTFLQVNAKLVGLRETVVGNKTFLDRHVSSIDGITTDAKRKWEEFSVQAGNDVNDCSDFSAAKHCRMEMLLQEWYAMDLRMFFYWNFSVVFILAFCKIAFS